MSSKAGETTSGPARVRVRLEGCEEREVEVGDGLSIGRGPENGLVIDHPSISRFHAEIRRDGESGHRLVDLDSLNGTFMNGRKLTAERGLFHADEIWVGEATLLFLDPQGPGRSDAADEAWRGLWSGIDWEVEDVELVCVVALMCDIRGCAHLAQKVPGGEFQAFVSVWWEEARALLDRHGAIMDGIERDALLVYWRVDHEDAPGPEVNTALRAVVELSALARRHARQFSERFGVDEFEVTAGMHLGDVSVAKLPDRDGYGVAGVTVLIADRLGELKPGESCAAVTSWHLAQWAAPEFRFHNLGEVSVGELDEPPLSALALDVQPEPSAS